MRLKYVFGVMREAMRRFVDDDHMVYAGHMAFTLLLSFGPFVVCAILLTKQFDPEADLHIVQMLASLRDSGLLPKAMADLFIGVIEQVSPKTDRAFELKDAWLVAVPAAVGLFAGSSAFEAARNGFNEAYDVREERGVFWKRFQSLLLAAFIAFLFSLASLGFVTITISFNVIGAIQAQLASIGVDQTIWSFVLLIALAAFIALLFWALLLGIHLTLPRAYVKRWHLYVWAKDETPDPRAVRVPLLPGVRFSAVAWVLFAVAYSSLLGSIIRFDSNHGALAGVVATLMFFYISAATIFFGAQINIAIATVDNEGRPKWPHPQLAREPGFDETRQEAYQVLTKSRPEGILSRFWHYLCGGTVVTPPPPDPGSEPGRV